MGRVPRSSLRTSGGLQAQRAFVRGNLEKSLVPKAVITEFVSGVAHVAELADALDSGSSE